MSAVLGTQRILLLPPLSTRDPSPTANEGCLRDMHTRFPRSKTFGKRGVLTEVPLTATSSVPPFLSPSVAARRQGPEQVVSRIPNSRVMHLILELFSAHILTDATASLQATPR